MLNPINPRLFLLIAYLAGAVGLIVIPQRARAEDDLSARARQARDVLARLDGTVASPKIAKEILKRIAAARSLAVEKR